MPGIKKRDGVEMAILVEVAYISPHGVPSGMGHCLCNDVRECAVVIIAK